MIADASPSSPSKKRPKLSYISLTTHPSTSLGALKIKWGESDPIKRGPVIASVGTTKQFQRNVIGAHSGSYCVYRGLAAAQGKVDRDHTPDLATTVPPVQIGPFPQWGDASKIGCLDPFGHDIVKHYGKYLKEGYDIRPTIAVTRAHIDVPEIVQLVKSGKMPVDGKVVANKAGQLNITKAAIEPVWYLPELARRFGCDEQSLRQNLFEQTNGMYPELMTRPDLKCFMPPIGGLTIYIFGDVKAITDPNKELTVRVHDECNGSDVFGSDICTCRPYLIHAIQVCAETAQRGGAGVCIYFRKEGRALGEVTKYLVYNLRKRQVGGDSAGQYFNCTERVAGVQDVRFQSMMPDALHWLGITQIDNFISMSDMKYNAIVKTGIKIVNRVPIPEELVPADAQVEMQAKVFAGYDGGDVYKKKTKEELDKVMGRPKPKDQ